MKRNKKLAAVLLAGIMTASIAGCGSQTADNTGDTGESAGEQYTVNMYLYGDGSERMTEFCNNEFKEKVQEAIGVNPNVQYLPWSEYAGGKTEVMYSAGEKFTACTDTTFLSKCVAKGYVADLTEASQNYAKNLMEYCGGQAAFDCFKVNGKQYAIPFGNKPNAGENYLLMVRQDILEEVGMTELKTVEDVERYYELAKEKYPDIIGMGGFNITFLFGALDTDMNIYRPNTFLMTDGNKPDDPTVYNFYASDEYRQICEIASRWVEKGIIPSYILSNSAQATAEYQNGKGLIYPGASYRIFEYTNTMHKVAPGAVLKNYYLGDPETKPLMSRGTYSTAFSVGANVTGEELDAYVQFIDLLQSSQEWNEFILYGVEGKDYTLNDAGQVERITQDSFFDSWLPDNVNFNRYPDYFTQEQLDTYKNWNEGCIDQKDIGFSFNMDPVKTEYAQLQAVEKEYFDPMTHGFKDYDSNIDTALEKLDEAGIDKFMEEYEKQFTEFLANK